MPLEYEKSAHMLSKIVSKPYDIEKQQRFYGVVMKGNSVLSASEDYWHYGFMGAFWWGLGPPSPPAEA